MALRSVAYSDNKFLLSAWSREHGRLTFAFPSSGSREGRRRRALTTPLALFEGVTDIRPGRDILSLRDLSPLPDSTAMAAPDAIRAVTATFLAEALDLLLRRMPPDDDLTDFLFSSARTLTRVVHPRAKAMFVHVFLYRLTRHAGIEPDMSNAAPAMIFDMRDGCFRHAAPLHDDYLRGEENEALAILSRARYYNMHKLQFSRNERQHILDRLLQYYGIHLSPLTSLKSLAVLRALE